MKTTPSVLRKSDKWIPWYFVLFFAAIAIIDGTFVTLAIKTHTGMVTEHAYEKGLAYNEILDKAAAQTQIDINQKAAFKDGVLSWNLSTKKGQNIKDAKVTARLFRPAQDGYDFDVLLENKENGLYEARPRFPLPGLWMARLEAQWLGSRSDNLQYKTALELIAP